MDAQTFSEKINNSIDTEVNNGTKGSFISNVLGVNKIAQAYNACKAEEKSRLQKLAAEYDKGQMGLEEALDASISSSLSKSMSSRYASRKFLYLSGYDKKYANMAVISFLPKAIAQINS